MAKRKKVPAGTAEAFGTYVLKSGEFKGRRLNAVALIQLDRVSRHPDTSKADKEALRDYLSLPGVQADLAYDVRFRRRVAPVAESCNEP